MNDRVYQLVSNYYKGELVSLIFKLVSSVFVILVFLLLKHYYPIDIVMYISNNIFVIYGIVFAKSVFQLLQYFMKRKKLLSQVNIDYHKEMNYIKAREAMLTYHRRFHVYSLTISFLLLILMMIFFNQYHQIISLFIALIIISTMLLSFSLFNSFRLSEYKFRLKDVFL